MALPYAMPHVFPGLVAPGIERQDHLELLWNCYERACTWQTSVALVVGEPGIGKTHLVTRLTARAAQEGATVLEGYASATQGMPPYLPFLEALGRYVHTAPLEQLRAQVALAHEALASLLPELTGRLGAPSACYAGCPEQWKLRLYEAVGSFLEAISMAHPLLLLLDDVHLADSESLALLCYIARRYPHARLLVIGTARAGEYWQTPAFAHALTELTRRRMLITLQAKPLSLLKTEALALSHLGGAIAPAVTLALYTKSEGNPLFAEELVQCWVEARVLTQAHNQWVLAAPVDDLLPSGIVNTLRQQLAQLCPKTLEQLRVAAIFGSHFDVSLLSALEGQEVEAVEACLQEAVHARLIVPGRAGDFRFGYCALRDYLYQNLAGSLRRRLHGQAALALEARCEQKPPKHSKTLAELAHHFTRSGDRARGILYAQRAAARALRAYVFQAFEAPLHSERVDTLVSLVSDLEAAAHAAQELDLVEWQQEALQAARAALEQVLTLAEKSPSPAALDLLGELVMPLVGSNGCPSEGQQYAQRLLQLAHCLADGQTAATSHPLVDETCLSPLTR